MSKRVIQKLEDEIFQLDRKSSIQVQYWNGECTSIERVPVKRVVLAILDRLDLNLTGTACVLERKSDK